MPTQRSSKSQQPVRFHNRIAAVMLHIPWYTVEGRARLAADVGVPRSTISRLILGQRLPSYALVQAVVAALEDRLGRHLEPREILSKDGRYPTPSVCTLVGCSGCLPDHAYDEEGNLKEAFFGVTPGSWSTDPKLLAAVAREEVL